jgi:protocatechuate 3,4-dioxygenase beta subunit
MKRTLPLLTVLATVGLTLRTGLLDPAALITRRTIVKLGGLGLLAMAMGAWRSRSSGTVASGTELVDAVRCVLSPEQTQGPYYVPREKVRSNITEHKPGTRLEMRITVVDAATCKPIKDAAVDIWHCDAGGIYSGFIAASTGAAPGGGPGGGSGPTDKQTFLRGIQLTDSHGRVQFETIYPGWYRGRTVHIHVMVHLGTTVGHVVHTGQLYFQDTLTARVYRANPYKARAAQRDTFNNTDGIFANGGAQSMLTMKRDGHGGYIGSITLGVRKA